MVESPSQWWDAETRGKLLSLLGSREELVDNLGVLVVVSKHTSSSDCWWYTTEAERIQKLAHRLDRAIARLKPEGTRTLSGAFNQISRSSSDDYLLWDDQEFGRFVQRLRFLAMGFPHRGAGRPREQARGRVAAIVAADFLKAGLKPSKSDTGIYAKVLRIVFRAAGFTVPDNMYRVVASGVRLGNMIFSAGPPRYPGTLGEMAQEVMTATARNE